MSQTNSLPDPQTPHTDAASRPQTQRPTAMDALVVLREQVDRAHEQALIDTSAWAKASEALDTIKTLLPFLV
jgi:hypothetical protein